MSISWSHRLTQKPTNYRLTSVASVPGEGDLHTLTDTGTSLNSGHFLGPQNSTATLQRGAQKAP